MHALRRQPGLWLLAILALMIVPALFAVRLTGATPATRPDLPHSPTAPEQAGPRLLIEASPLTQQFLPGGNATFSVVVTNIGSVSFSRVAITADNAPDCERANLGTLAIGQARTYECSRATVTDSFLLTLTATGQTNSSGPAADTTSAFVNVLKPELRLIKRMTTQVLAPGETARFTVVIFNTSSAVTLNQVEVVDPMAPDCSFQPATPLTLLPGDSYDYSCSLTDVQAPVIAMATATATDADDGTLYTASDVAWVDIIDMEAALTPAETSVPEPTVDIAFTVELENKGSVFLDLTTLSTDRYGNLLDPDNPLIDVAANTCLPSPVPPTIPPGGLFTCTFIGTVFGQPSTFGVELDAAAQDAEGNTTDAAAATAITIVDVDSAISVNVSANPSIVQSPGQIVDYEITILNESPADTVIITSLTDSILGNLDTRGTCDVPAGPIPVGGAYMCLFSTAVNGVAGTSVVREIAAAGVDDDPVPNPVRATDTIEVPITDRQVTQSFLPSVTDDVVEPNNRCSQAYPMALNKPYLFAVEDGADLYRFTLGTAGTVSIEMTNFVLLDSQILVYKGACPSDPIAINQANALNKRIELGNRPADDYWVYIVNPQPSGALPPYGLIIRFE